MMNLSHFPLCLFLAEIENRISTIEFCSMKFLSPEIALYLYKSIIRSRMKYCSHVWGGAPSCYLELFDKLQNVYAGLLVIPLISLLNPWFIVEM